MLNQEPFATGLDKVKINNNDEILVYQVADNLVPWLVTHLTTGTDSLKLNQEVDLQLMSYSCSMDQNRSVAVNSSKVLAYRNVQIELQPSTKSATTYTTDEFGKMAVILDKVGEYLFISGMDASKLFVESTTGITHIANNKLLCKVFPNPFSAHLRIDIPATKALVQIVDLQGRIVYSEPYSQPLIDLHHLSQGFYFLKIQSGSQIFQQKLIKQ